MTQVRRKPAAPRFRVKHSTTEPLHSLHSDDIPERIFSKKNDFEKNKQTAIKHEKLPSRQRVNPFIPHLLTLCMLGYFWLASAKFFKLNFFQKIFQEHYLSDKQFGFSSGLTFCRS